MEVYITELSRYFIAGAAVLYALISFWIVTLKTERRRRLLYVCQVILMLAILGGFILQMEARTGKVTYLFFFAFMSIILGSAMMLFHMIYPDGCQLLVHNMCLMLMSGMVLLIRLDTGKAVRQFGIAAVSLIVGMLMPYLMLRMKFLKKLTFVYAIAGIAALGVVLLLGSVTHGSKLSYSLAGITFQPSEVVKIFFIFFLAAAFAESRDFVQILLITIFAAAHVLILVFSKDLGSALIFFVVFVCLLFLATENPLYLFAGAAAGAAASLIAYRLFTHVQIRVQTWLNPWNSIDSGGYQITQSLFGISGGGFFGLGLFGGNPKAIPFVEADFIFAAVAEEMGLIYGIALLLIGFSSFLMIMKTSVRIRDRFYRYAGFGIGVTYIFQVFLTVGGETKFIPLTGVTLPFVSYGGTSVLVSIALFMLFEGCCLRREEEHRLRLERLRREQEMAQKMAQASQLQPGEEMMRHE